MTALGDLGPSELGEIAALHAVNHLEHHDHLVAILGPDGAAIPDGDHRAIYSAGIAVGRSVPDVWSSSWGAPRQAIAERLGDRRRWGWRLLRLGAGLDEHVGHGVEAARLLVQKTRARKLAIALAHEVYDLNEGVDPDAVQRRLGELGRRREDHAPEPAPGAEERRRHADARASLPPPPVPRRRRPMEGAA